MKLTNQQFNIKENIQEDLVKINNLETMIKKGKEYIKSILLRIEAVSLNLKKAKEMLKEEI